MEISALAGQTTAATSAFSSLTQNFDTFLTLLTTQLRNQDPLDPLDTEKFTEQLVQFAGVEQSIKTNAHLEALIKLQTASERGGALDLVGRNVTVETDRATFDGTKAEWTYTLPNGAASVLLTVVDDKGAAVVRKSVSGAAGANALTWDGVKDNGAAAAAGVYRLIVDARDANGAPLNAATQSTARVTAAVFGDDGTSLETSLGVVPFDAIRRVAAN